MKVIKNKFDKHDIPNLPKVTFGGRIITVFSPEEAERAVDYLLAQPILGLDTETKPSFKPGSGMNKVALLQVSTPDTCFLFRLNQMGMPAPILRLLEDDKVIKVGLSWHDDLIQLHRRADFQAGTFVELQEMIKLIGVQDLSLQKIYANLFGQKISKTQRLTNWEADILSPGQQVYAATDAWACIQIYNEILRLTETQDYELEVVPEPEPPVPAEPKEPAKPKEPVKPKEPAKPKAPRKPRRKRKPKSEREKGTTDDSKADPSAKKPRASHRRKRANKQ